VRRSSEEALAVTDLDDIQVTDLAIGLTGNDLEEVTVRANRRRRDVSQLLTRHFGLTDFVVCSIDLDPEIWLLVVLWLFVGHFGASLLDILIPRYHIIGVLDKRGD